MRDEQTLDEVVGVIRERIANYPGQSIGEQNTKVGLIAPVLRALGWDVEDIREVHLEYRRRPTDKPVDYALLLNGAPRLFVEAKALDGNLDDPRWANQIISYATVAGVRWVVLSNGDEYRLYNSHAEVPVEEKLFRKVRVSDKSSNPEETLALLSKESIAELEALWQEDFVDRQVQAALEALFEPEPDDGLIRLIRRHLSFEVSPRKVREAIARLRGSSLPPPVASSPRPGPGPEMPPGEKAAFGEGTPWSNVTLGDTISAGVLSPPTELYRRYKGQEIRARIEPDGRVSFNGRLYGSLSAAGMTARRSIVGEQLRAQTNGWTFWKYRNELGEWREIDELRRRLWERRAGD